MRFQNNFDNKFFFKNIIPKEPHDNLISQESGSSDVACEESILRTKRQNSAKHLISNLIDKPENNFSGVQRQLYFDFGISGSEPAHAPVLLCGL